MEYRKIIHVDMDAFYASVEQREHPEFRGRPLVVGRPGERSVVSAASYEARKFGIRSAMPSVKAARLCPDVIFVPGNMELYRSVSAQIHRIFHEYTDLVEPLALDEAFLDVTENKPGILLAVDIAREIKRKVRERLSLVASAGVSGKAAAGAAQAHSSASRQRQTSRREIRIRDVLVSRFFISLSCFSGRNKPEKRFSLTAVQLLTII